MGMGMVMGMGGMLFASGDTTESIGLLLVEVDVTVVGSVVF